MIADLVFGAKLRRTGPSDYQIRPRVLHVDALLDAYHAMETHLPDHEVKFTTSTSGGLGGRDVSPGELRDLTSEERLGLVLQAFRGAGIDAAGAAVGFSGIHITIGASTRVNASLGAEQQPAFEEVLRVFGKERARFQPRRLRIFALPLLMGASVVGWIAGITLTPPGISLAIGGSAVVLLVTILSGQVLSAQTRHLEAVVLPHRFVPLSFAQLAEQRANRRRDFVAAVIGAVATIGIAFVLKLLGVDL